MTTRADVLTTLRRLGYAVGSGDLAQIMDAPSYVVRKCLGALYSRDLIDREMRSGASRFVYSAKAVRP